MNFLGGCSKDSCGLVSDSSGGVSLTDNNKLLGVGDKILGTTDATDLKILTDNKERIVLNANGDINLKLDSVEFKSGANLTLSNENRTIEFQAVNQFSLLEQQFQANNTVGVKYRFNNSGQVIFGLYDLTTPANSLSSSNFTITAGDIFTVQIASNNWTITNNEGVETNINASSLGSDLINFQILNLPIPQIVDIIDYFVNGVSVSNKINIAVNSLNALNIGDDLIKGDTVNNIVTIPNITIDSLEAKDDDVIVLKANIEGESTMEGEWLKSVVNSNTKLSQSIVDNGQGAKLSIGSFASTLQAVPHTLEIQEDDEINMVFKIVKTTNSTFDEIGIGHYTVPPLSYPLGQRAHQIYDEIWGFGVSAAYNTNALNGGTNTITDVKLLSNRTNVRWINSGTYYIRFTLLNKIATWSIQKEGSPEFKASSCNIEPLTGGHWQFYCFGDLQTVTAYTQVSRETKDVKIMGWEINKTFTELNELQNFKDFIEIDYDNDEVDILKKVEGTDISCDNVNIDQNLYVGGELIANYNSDVVWNANNKSSDITINGKQVSKPSNGIVSYVYSTKKLVPQLYDYDVIITCNSCSGTKTDVIFCENKTVPLNQMPNYKPSDDLYGNSAIAVQLRAGGSIGVNYKSTQSGTGNIAYNSVGNYVGNNSVVKLQIRSGICNVLINDVLQTTFGAVNYKLDLDKDYYISVQDVQTSAGGFDVEIDYNVITRTPDEKNLTFLDEGKIIKYKDNSEYSSYSLPKLSGTIGVKRRIRVAYTASTSNDIIYEDDNLILRNDDTNDLQIDVKNVGTGMEVFVLNQSNGAETETVISSPTGGYIDIHTSTISTGDTMKVYILQTTGNDFPMYEFTLCHTSQFIIGYLQFF